MSYNFHLNKKGFSQIAQSFVNRAQKSPYLNNMEFNKNVYAEFIGKDGKIIRMVVKPDGSYSLTSFAPETMPNAICSEFIMTKNGMVMKDVLKSVEMKAADKNSPRDILLTRDFTEDARQIKAYIRNKGEKIWTAVKRVI